MGGRPEMYSNGKNAAIAARSNLRRFGGQFSILNLISRLSPEKSTYCRGFLITLVKYGNISSSHAHQVWANLELAHPEWIAGLLEPEYAREDFSLGQRYLA